jgi:hypothetical protein
VSTEVAYEVRHELQMWRVFRNNEFFWQAPGNKGVDADAVALDAGQHEAELAPFPQVEVRRADGSVEVFGPNG